MPTTKRTHEEHSKVEQLVGDLGVLYIGAEEVKADSDSFLNGVEDDVARVVLLLANAFDQCGEKRRAGAHAAENCSRAQCEHRL